MRKNPGSPSPTREVRPFGPIFVAAVMLLLLGGCAPRREAAGPLPRLSQFEGDEVLSVDFTGDLRFPVDSLEAVVQTHPSECRFLLLPFCFPVTGWGREEYRLNLGELALDVARIQLYHRDHGYYSARVEPDVQRVDGGVSVEFVIAPGRQVVLRDLRVEGTDSVIPEDELRAAMPLAEGEPFGRVDFLASADTIRLQLLQRGHAYADVLRNYSIDTIAGVAEAEYVALPGPVVYVDTIIFQGNERLGEPTLRRQMTLAEGDLLRLSELTRSQRNLYNLNMVDFASVRLAPDSVQVEPVQERATILVQLVEAAQYAVEGSLGFGTVDCIRSSGRWINRNFLGGGRQLDVNASVSRIGVGNPTDVGLDESVCDPLGDEGLLALSGFEIEDRLDYRLSADLQQPSIFGTQNQLAVNLHTERVSESDAFVRESVGGSVAAVRQIESGPTLLTTTVDVARGRTLASPAILCVGFDTCSQQDLQLLRQYRWSNSIAMGLVRDAQQTDGIVSRGYVLRGGLTWSSPVLGSADDYLRALAEGAYYHPLQPGWVLAANLRIGRFLRGILGGAQGYIPPERRFYAGGPNSVRGYTRNALGPTSYIILPEAGDTIGSATGGTQMIVSSLELRMPSPWFGQGVRLAAFVDAGQVTAPGADLFEAGGIRITPGVGARIVTPVGPFRFDIAYNPYRRESGPLYLVDRRAGLILMRPNYAPAPPSFWGRFRIQFALGQAF